MAISFKKEIETFEETISASDTELAKGGIVVEQTMTINRSAPVLYEFWRDFTNLPKVMQHLERIHSKDESTTVWKLRGPLGERFEWNGIIVNDEPDKSLSWRSTEDADLQHFGSIHFKAAPRGRGTEVTIVLKYDLPGGMFTEKVAKLFGEDPEQKIKEDLRRFKQWMEAGEIPTIEGQSVGHCGRGG